MYPRPTASGVGLAAAAGEPAGRPDAGARARAAITGPDRCMRRRGDRRRGATDGETDTRDTAGPPIGLSSADQATLDGDDDEIEPDPDEGDRQERGEHERDVEQRPAGEVDQDAETALGAGPLADDRADDRERDPDADPAQDDRQRGRDLERRSGPGGGSRAGPPELEEPASTERIPTIVAIATGKNTISAQMTTLPSSPGPNHRAMSGARARIGVACAATRYGETRRSTNALRAST